MVCPNLELNLVADMISLPEMVWGWGKRRTDMLVRLVVEEDPMAAAVFESFIEGSNMEATSLSESHY